MKQLERAVKRFFIKVLSLVVREHRGHRLPLPAEIRRILVIRNDRLGDFILAIPAISLLAENLGPGAKLDILAGPRAQAIAKKYFGEGSVVLYRGFFRTAAFLARARFDAVIDLHSYPFSMTTAMLTLLTGCRARIGYKETELVKNALAPKVFNKGIVLNDNSLHERDKNILLVEQLGIKYDSNRQASYLEYRVPGGKPQKDPLEIGIHPTLVKKDNRWSKQRYIELCGMLAGAGRKIVVFHGMGEEKELEEFRGLAAGLPGIEYFPRNDIISMTDRASRCAAFVCGDSGVMHAASLVTDVVAVFGPSPLSRWRPIGPNRITALQKEDRMCDSVTAEEVMQALSEMGKV